MLEHYLTGNAPPAPGNVRGSVVESRQLADGRDQYRRVQLSFGKASGDKAIAIIARVVVRHV